MKLLRTFASTAALLTLCACGGGGDGQNAFVRPTDIFDARAAWQNLLAANRSWTLSGTASDGKVYEVTMALSPAAEAVFPPTGVRSAVTNVLATVRQAGGGSASRLTEVFHDAASGLPLGDRITPAGSATSSCEKYTPGSAVLPPSAVDISRADASGPFYTSSSLPNCANNAADGTTTGTWSVEFKAGITFFCLNTVQRDLAATPNIVATESDCVQINPNGTLRNGARVILSDDSGFSIVAVN